MGIYHIVKLVLFSLGRALDGHAQESGGPAALGLRPVQQPSLRQTQARCTTGEWWILPLKMMR